VFVQIEGWTSAASGQAYLKVYNSFGSEFMWTGTVWSNGTAYSAANQPVVNIDASGNWSGWIYAKHNDALVSAVSVRAAKIGDTGTRLTSGAMTITPLNMQGTGNGGWIMRTSSPVVNKSIVAYAGGAIAGSYRTEENGLAEGYAYASGGFKIAVPAGIVDSLVILDDDGSRDRTFVGPWSIVAGQETEAALDGSTVGRGNVQLSPAVLSGGTPQDVRIVVRGETSYVITDVRVVVPSTWFWSHLPADITYSGGGSPGIDVSGDTVRTSGLSLIGTDSAAFTIHNITPPDSTVLYHFFSSTGTHSDSVLPVTTQPSVFVYSIPLPISTVRENDANGVPLRNSTLVTVRGILTVANEFGGPSYIQDNTGGMAIFGSSFSTAVAAGDEVLVSGLVQPFNGLLEIVNPQLHLRVSSGNVVEPLVVTAAEITHDGAGGVESYEGRLVRVNNVRIGGSGVWGANTNYVLADATDSTEIRIDNGTNLVGLPIPSSAMDVIGVVGQYVTASPFVGGYQLMPRSATDVMTMGPGISSVPRETDLTASSFRIEWTTALPGTSRLRYGRTSGYELGIIEPDAVSRTIHGVSVTGLEAAAIYHVQVFSVSGSDTSTAGGMVVSTSSPAGASGILRAYFNKSVFASLAPADPAAGTQDFVALLVGKIASARRSVDAALYNLSGTPGPGTDIAQALIAAKQRGLRVRVICEQDNRSTSPFNSLVSAGVPLITDAYDPANAGAGLMHNKFFVIDAYGGAPESVWVWTGSWNPSLPGTNDDYQNVVEVQDPALAGAYTLEFEEMWGSNTDAPNQANARFGARKTDNTPHHFVIGGRPVSCYFSPSDDATARIIDAIATADHSLHFTLLTFTRTDIAAALLARRAPGFALSGVMDNGTDAGSQYDYLVSQGVDIRLKTGSGLLHHKYAVLDAGYPNSRPMVITGSHNWTNSAENTNSENTLIIEDATLALHYVQEFAARYYQFGGTDSIRADVEAVSLEVPAAIGLLQNYPNPFNATTTIGLRVRGMRTSSQLLSLKVFDVLGREAATLLDGPLAAGEYRISFDASRLASGIYVYVLRAGQFQDAKTMVLVR
jgi:phosphatidylserine/phosphatidylglycerophosphate/cardiolipin synthase-like enzyme